MPLIGPCSPFATRKLSPGSRIRIAESKWRQSSSAHSVGGGRKGEAAWGLCEGRRESDLILPPKPTFPEVISGGRSAQRRKLKEQTSLILPSHPSTPRTGEDNKACASSGWPSHRAQGASLPAAERGRRRAASGRTPSPSVARSLPWAAQRARVEARGGGHRASSWAGVPSRSGQGPVGGPGRSSQWRTGAAASNRGHQGCSRRVHAASPVPLSLLLFLFCAQRPPRTCQEPLFFNGSGWRGWGWSGQGSAAAVTAAAERSAGIHVVRERQGPCVQPALYL
jgi:hypothetical protein